MALITRISRLFRADFNAVLDRIEEPDVLLKQAIREMEEDLYNDKQRLKRQEKEYVQLQYKISEIERNIEQVNHELDICIEANEDDLARNQVKRKMEMQRYEKHCRSKLESIKNKIEELKARIAENSARFNVMQQKLELFTEDKSMVKSDEFISGINMSVNDNDIEMAFLREKQARSSS